MTEFCIETYINNLPENTEIINITSKQIKYLPDVSRFKYLRSLNCSNNQLVALPTLNENLRELYCNNNQLVVLPTLNKHLQLLNCANNQLVTLPTLNENLQELYYDNNPIYEIIDSNNLFIINKKLKILHKFCYLYYCLKFKTQFRDFLWKKIREPKIIQKYHPSYFDEFLKDDNDNLDMVLDNWL
jgi:hypothetical protein